jgi:nicotinamidase-related amidase
MGCAVRGPSQPLKGPTAIGAICSDSTPKEVYVMQTFTKIGLEALLTPENCVMLLIDHQPFQLANVNSHDPTIVINNVTGLAKTAKAFGIPTILTTVKEDSGGAIFKQLQAVFPEQKPINRTFINAWEDRRVVEAVKKTGRKKLVIAALWTEMCLAMPAIHAMGDGYDVYVVTDASGGVTPEAHDMGIRRLVVAGAQPITWLALAGELQRDWARTEHLGEVVQLLIDHAGASGSVLVWETQLLSASSSQGSEKLAGRRG